MPTTDRNVAAVHDRTVVGGTGYSVELRRGDRVRVVNTFGQQVVDTWALGLPGGDHRLSMSHTRLAIGRISPRVGDVLVDDQRRPMLRLLTDTSAGGHDTLIPACDAQRYRALGYDGEHASCTNNYIAAVTSAQLPVPVAAPDPLNLFMAVPVAADGDLRLEASTAASGSCVGFEALQHLLLVVSACPQDMVPISGAGSPPRSVDLHAERTGS